MIELIRTVHDKKFTLGQIIRNSEFLCDTVERPWLENQNHISCIPEGTYECIEFQSPHNGNVWLLKDVPNRKYIEIHSANFAHELEGCIAVGKGHLKNAGETGVANSKATMKYLKQVLPKSFQLTIRSTK